MDDKDRLGTKLREKEKAEEDLYFSHRELIEKMKQQKATAEAAFGRLIRSNCMYSLTRGDRSAFYIANPQRARLETLDTPKALT